jgi:transposase
MGHNDVHPVTIVNKKNLEVKMTPYHNFVGIDIGKFNFVVAEHAKKETKEYKNNSEGIEEFLKDHKKNLKTSLCILETTGGYELNLLYTLCKKKITVHRANTRKVKNFIRSYGNAAKTDNLDAKALAKYGFERHDQLEPFELKSERSIELFSLVQRRTELKQLLVAEKNRLQSPSCKYIQNSIEQLKDFLSAEILAITNQINNVINDDTILKKKKEVLKTVPGIGDITAFELIVLLPELGTLDRRKIASLAGLAPMSNESGKYLGYRRTGHGRGGIKPILFLSAMAARNSKTELRDFYEKLIAKGKKKMVALTALMRKILVIANARLKEAFPL